MKFLKSILLIVVVGCGSVTNACDTESDNSDYDYCDDLLTECHELFETCVDNMSSGDDYVPCVEQFCRCAAHEMFSDAQCWSHVEDTCGSASCS